MLPPRVSLRKNDEILPNRPALPEKLQSPEDGGAEYVVGFDWSWGKACCPTNGCPNWPVEGYVVWCGSALGRHRTHSPLRHQGSPMPRNLHGSVSVILIIPNMFFLLFFFIFFSAWACSRDPRCHQASWRQTKAHWCSGTSTRSRLWFRHYRLYFSTVHFHHRSGISGCICDRPTPSPFPSTSSFAVFFHFIWRWFRAFPP